MTVPNVMPGPAPQASVRSGGESVGSGAEDFAAALGRLLDPAPSDVGEGGHPAVPIAGDTDGDATAAPTEGGPALVALPTTLPASAVPVPPAATAGAGPTDGPTDGPAQSPAPGPRTVTTPALPPSLAADARVAARIESTADATTAPSAPAGAAPSASTPAPVVPPVAPAALAASVPRASESSPAVPVGGTDAVPTLHAASTGQPATVPAAASAPTTASAVPGQVFPHVTQLVSRGDGRHSITLRLHPADLGEVRVTVTVKNGAVDVTMAAGAEARQALRSGSGELRTLLELAGAATGNVVIRDLPGATTAPVGGATATGDPGAAATTHGDADADAGGAGSEERRHPDARARDGTSPYGTATARPDRGTEALPPTARDVGTPTSLDLTL